MKVLIAVSLLMCLVAVTNADSRATCKRRCKTPELHVYCCEEYHEHLRPVYTKPGLCPPVPPSCPPIRSFDTTQTCSNDGICGDIDKCCYDRCLEQHVCKPPQGSGGYGGIGGAFGGISGFGNGIGGGFGFGH